jgi:hypothetical protein
MVTNLGKILSEKTFIVSYTCTIIASTNFVFNGLHGGNSKLKSHIISSKRSFPGPLRKPLLSQNLFFMGSVIQVFSDELTVVKEAHLTKQPQYLPQAIINQTFSNGET